MLRNTRYVLLCALAVLAASPPVLAHGVEASAASMDMSHGTHGAMNMSNTEDWPDYRNYFSHPEHTGLMYVHILLTILSWVVLMPIGKSNQVMPFADGPDLQILAVMLSIARSRFTLPAQLAFFATNATGIVASILYNQQTPDLYSGNSHHKGAWAITCIATAWFLMSLLKPYTKRSIDHEYFALSTQPASQSAMAEHDRLHDLSKFRQQRWSRDSGIASQVSSSRPSSLNSEFHRLPMHLMMEQQEDQDEQNMDEIHEPSTPEGTKFNRLLSLDFVSSLLNSLYVTLERFLIPLGFVALVTGTVAYSGIGRGNHIFNILAHLVKGSIFSGYGLLTFGRYLGAFPLFGWNWSLRPSTRVRNWTSRVPSAEFVESFVIWLYGYVYITFSFLNLQTVKKADMTSRSVTNVGLERLAAADGPWTPMDVEHVGISMLFFGGGMLGMLIESFTVRRFLDRIVPGAYSNESSVAEGQDQYRHSLNPMPALTICLLGYIMSSHTQHS